MFDVLTIEMIEKNIVYIALSLLIALILLVVMLQRQAHKVRQLERDLDAVNERESSSQQALDLEWKARHAVEVENGALRAKVEQLEKHMLEREKKIAELDLVAREHIQLQVRFAEKETQIQSQEKLLAESKKSLLKEFELAASKLFDAKQRNFHEASRHNIEGVLTPFKEQLLAFHKHVDNLYANESAQRNQLIGQIGELQKQATKISEDANNLTHALKGDNRAQGQWGEIILERLLEQSGLENGREYSTQIDLKNEQGRSYRPDVVIHLPEKKDIIIDSKVALLEYERFANEEDPEQRKRYLKAHTDSIRSHMRNLSSKNYEKLEGIRSIDFIFMFIPIETAYSSAMHNSPQLFSDAQKKNIMIVSPSSLMVALRTVETMWRYEKQNTNAEKIAASAGKLYDQFALVMNAFEDLGTYLNKASQSHDLVFNRLSSGRGNLFKRIDELKKLGAKTTKQLPSASQKRLEEVDNQTELVIDGE